MHRSGLADYWDDGPKDGPLNAFQRAFDADPLRVWKPSDILAHVPTLKPAGVPDTVHNYRRVPKCSLLGEVSV